MNLNKAVPYRKGAKKAKPHEEDKTLIADAESVTYPSGECEMVIGIVIPLRSSR